MPERTPRRPPPFRPGDAGEWAMRVGRTDEDERGNPKGAKPPLDSTPGGAGQAPLAGFSQEEPSGDDPGEQHSVALEDELHRLDAEIGRLREQMLLLRGLERTPERQARMDVLEARYEELGARFVAAYREWNTLP